MTKDIKQCSVRIPEELHRWAKSHAYHVGMTLQEFICSLIEEEKRIVQQRLEYLEYLHDGGVVSKDERK